MDEVRRVMHKEYPYVKKAKAFPKVEIKPLD